MHCYRTINIAAKRILHEMKRYLSHLSLALFLLHISCVAQQAGQTSGDVYTEDLTILRPKYESAMVDSAIKPVEVNPVKHQTIPTKTVNTKVDMVLDSLDKINLLKKFVDGFTIQIYSGPRREDALSAKSKMVKEAADLEANIQYTQPKFRVTAGTYFSKIEAQKDLLRLRRIFPNAILVPEKIMVR